MRRKISLDEPAPKPDIVFGKSKIEEAKITGITPAVFILRGKCEDSPPYILVPICLLGQFINIFRTARSIKTIKATVTSISVKIKIIVAADKAPVLPSSKVVAKALGISATIPEKIIKECNPDTIYTHFWGDVNQDHKKIFDITLIAARPTPNSNIQRLICYETPSSTEWGNESFKPNLFVGNFNEKIKQNIKRVKGLPKIKGVKEILYPGQNKQKRFLRIILVYRQ